MLKIKTTKVNMTQVFLESGKVVPVTILKCDSDLSEELLYKSAVLVGTSKGKGFTGVMKKWNFSGQQATRGQSDRPRAAGAIGGQTPGRVFLGKKMAGRHGNKRITLKNISILGVDLENKFITVSGPVPGARNSKVELIIEGIENN